MDELLKGADSIKSVYSKFFDGLKSTAAASTPEGVGPLVDEYLNTFDSVSLPEGVENVLKFGEKPFAVPETTESVKELVLDETNRLARIELAELAQDGVISQLISHYCDATNVVNFTEEELKKQAYLHNEIQFSLKSEVVKRNPTLVLEELEDIPEPRDEEAIQRNSAIVKQFFDEIASVQDKIGPQDELDLSKTFVVPRKPQHDPMSFVQDLAVRNMYGVSMKPLVDDNAQIIGANQLWDKAVDAKSAAKAMKYERFPDPSIPANLKGNGLEVPLEIAKIGLAEVKLDDLSYLEEEKYTDMQVLLKMTDDAAGRWPGIRESLFEEDDAKVLEDQVKAPTIEIRDANVFELANYLTETRIDTIEPVDTESADFSAFVKKKKKKKPLDEALPSSFDEQIRLFEKQEDLELLAKEAPPKPTLTSADDKYEFAIKLDVSSDVAEYLKMKHNLARTFPFELDPFQQQAVVAMENGNSVFVAAHTSAGKTVVAEYAIALSRKHRSRVIYTSPIKALSNQKFRDFKNEFDDVGLITGDIQLNTEASCLVMTTEILKSMLYNGRVSPDELEWVIFDEVHYINDAERGHVWEEVLIMLPTQVNIVMLSATVPNCLEFADWVGRIKNRKIYVVMTLYRPVPLVHHIYCGRNKKSINDLFQIMDRKGDFLEKNYSKACEAQMAAVSKNKQGGAKRGTQKKSTYIPKGLERSHYSTLVRFLEKENLLPAVVFVFSRQRCNDYGDLLSHIDLTTSDEKAAVKRLFTKYLDSFKGSDKNLPQVLKMQQLCYRGFAIHHSGILPILKELVEILFQKGYVKVLLATETFAIGVNMPARTVVFDSAEKFDGTCRRVLNCTEYIQMAGRAGRRGIDDTGMVIVLSKGQHVLDHSVLLPMLRGKPVSLESKFRITYNMLLNILRAEELNIEDMLQRSYVERVSLRNMAQRKIEIARLIEELKDLPLMECKDCYPGDYSDSVDCYHDSLIQYIQQRAVLLPMLVKSCYSNLLQPGRYLVISIPEKSLAGLLVCVLKFTQNASENFCEMDVVTLQPTTETDDALFSQLTASDKKAAVDKLLFESTTKHGLEAVIDNKQASGQLICYKNVSLQNIVGICKKKSKYLTEKEVSAHLQEQLRPSVRRNSPTRNVSNLMTEMDTILRAAFQKQDDNLFYKIGDDLVIKEIDVYQQINDFARLRQKLVDNDEFLCKKCLDFDDHLSQVRYRQLLEEKKRELNFQTSVGALVLSDDYQNCLKVLKELNFIDKDNIVLLKGRVAAQINEDTLLLTELIFENRLQHRGCSEIASMLCTLTAQHHYAKDKANERDCRIITTVANQEVINSLRSEMADMANKIDAMERRFCVTESRKGQEPTFGLMEAVYQWAEGMSFEQITHLTEAHEGLIVRCIQRLDEILKDIRNAGRIIGDSALVQKMEDTSAAIRRDIVFAASLYTADD